MFRVLGLGFAVLDLVLGFYVLGFKVYGCVGYPVFLDQLNCANIALNYCILFISVDFIAF